MYRDFGCDFICGWIAGVASLLVGHPFDTVKVRQQTFKQNRLIPVITNTIRNEGILGFYRGLLLPIMTAGVQSCSFFGTYGNVLRLLEHSDVKGKRFCCEGSGSYPGWHTHVAISGAIAGAVTAIISCPVELIKIQQQVMTEPLRPKLSFKDAVSGSIKCAQYVYNIGGIRLMYKGGLAILLRDTPGYCIYILAYEHSFCLLEGKIEHGQNPKIISEVVAGGVSGIMSWTLMPIDVVKSRLQGDNLRNPTYKGILDCVRKSYKKHGFKIFMQGFWVCIMRAFPTNAITFAVYGHTMGHCTEIAF